MLQKCSYLRVLEIFFIEPTSVHFIKELGKRIGLAPTSVRNHVRELQKEGLIKKKPSRPFDGFVANRESDDFIFFKRVYNLYSLKDLARFIAESLYPKAIILFGSYSLGEDVESSDIDIAIISKTGKELDLKKFEAKLKRNIHITTASSPEKVEINIRKKIARGIILHGGI